MANSLCLTPLASFNSVNKPGLINGNCTGRNIQWIKDVIYSSKSSLRVLEVKATDSDQNAKSRSIICKNCDGNGAVLCSQCKGIGVNSEDYFSGRFKAGELCWLCGYMHHHLCF
ncbi:protein BUNDLE SHEATH DEFECTIVE 2, chloroplastic-like isoform X2 [Nicotiana sylvestris]|uniref:protein BUNDLE SHEATH DEFECTIVE 2, chloroplastic-like isoform X2 n=1 Tax=Nicotiana sylvestris TaxID=4096 RepID=UPI00388C3593